MSGMQSYNPRYVALAKGGTSPRDIAARFGVARETVYAHLKCARRQGVAVPYGRTGFAAGTRRWVTIPLAREALEKLTYQADLRGLTERELAARLLMVICQDLRLVSAILDDGEEVANV